MVELRTYEGIMFLEPGLKVSLVQSNRKERRGKPELVFISGRIFQIFWFWKSTWCVFCGPVVEERYGRGVE